jgi:hypothetical protein
MERDNRWVSMEQYRLDVVRAWPASAYKDATLAAIYSTPTSLVPGHTDAPTTNIAEIKFVLADHPLPSAA